MKKVIALICLIALACPLFASCEKAPDFVPIDENSIKALAWASGGNGKDINKSEYYSVFVEAYNSVTETMSYEDETVEWSIVAICGDENSPNSIYCISSVGKDTYNVSISGGEQNIRYSVDNESLSRFADEELFAVKPVSAKVTVTFTVSADVMNDDGTARDGDEILNTSEQTVTGNEEDLPSVSGAIRSALILEGLAGGNDVLRTEPFIVTSVKGYDKKTDVKKNPAEIYSWDIYLNGEAVKDADKSKINDGDRIDVIYVIRHPGE